MEIFVVGPNDSKSNYLFTVVQTAIKELKIDAKLLRVTNNFDQITPEVKIFPSLILNDNILISGRVPSITEIKFLIKNLLNQ